MHDEHEDEWLEDENVKSKTQIKQEMTALQELGVKLIDLTPEQQAKIPMGDALRRAIEEAPRITHNSGRRRHLQFIGKLMRKDDGEAIAEAYEAIMEKTHKLVRQHHQMENWRDRLLKDEKALAEFIRQFPHCERQQLRQLIRGAQKEQSQSKPPASARKLFKFIRQCFESE